LIADAEQLGYVDLVARLGARNLPPGGEAMLEDMLARLPSDPRLILDLGCNTGMVSARAAAARPRATVVGIDRSPAMIDVARRRHEALNLEFAELDVEGIGDAFDGVDAALCAGSAAFFPDRVAALASLDAALAVDGVLIDAHYVYDREVPPALRQLERSSFGIESPPSEAFDCLAPYERAGPPVRSYVRRPRWRLTERPTAPIYRELLASLPGMAPLVDEMLKRRELAHELSAYRHPVLVTAGRDTPTSVDGSAPDGHGVGEALAVMQLFRGSIAPQPVARLRSLRPYEFLAYVGDPDAAPGGAGAVTRAAAMLRELGLDDSASVLDVGCFTGMSTLALARSFPNVVGIDIEPAFVRVARSVGTTLRARARFEVMDGGDTRLPPRSRDAYVLTATLGYTPQPERLLAEASRIVRPGGFLVEFLYHYPVVTAAIEDRVRRAVGPDVRVSGLSTGVRAIERAGFRLVRADRLRRASAQPRFLAGVCSATTALERERNPELSERDLAEFADLFRSYVGRVDLGEAEPLVYMCVFEKAEPERKDRRGR
jgi:SAM-dependent methyltransferase